MNDNKTNINWYPGHMSKTRRMIAEELKSVDAVCEIVDARIPAASRNPDVDAIVGAVPRMIILNRADQASPAGTEKWLKYFASAGMAAIAADSKSGAGIRAFEPAARRLLREKLEKDAARGRKRPMRFMIVGVPNVGKSSFINRLSGRRPAKAEDRPGVTRSKQWINVSDSVQLLDTPGILWPKFDDEKTGLYLAFTGAVRDEVLDEESVAYHFVQTLYRAAPEAIKNRYGVEPSGDAWEDIQSCAKARGFLLSGAELDTARMSRVMLDEYRSGKLGRITLESPEDAYGSMED